MLERYSSKIEKHRAMLRVFVHDPANENFFRRVSSLSNEETLNNLENLLRGQFFFWSDGQVLPPVLVALFNYDAAAGTAELGCCVRPEYRGDNLAFKATAELGARLFYGNVFMQKLTATCLAEDTHTRHVLEKGGWTLEGEFKNNVYFQGEIKDEVRYCIFREEYEERYGHRYADWEGEQLWGEDAGPFQRPADAGVGEPDEVGQQETTMETDPR